MGRGAGVVSLGPEWLAADDTTAVYWRVQIPMSI